jgi:hypothetical protein
MKSAILTLLCFTIFLTGVAYGGNEEWYPSPDSKYQAFVISLPRASYGTGESEVIIKTKGGKALISKSYGSEDGEHGFGVEKAQWMPDSHFFVYSMSSSGGHQPWRSPVYFISVHDLKIRSIEDYIGSPADPEFKLSSPDRISFMTTQDGAGQVIPFEGTLSELAGRKTKK